MRKIFSAFVASVFFIFASASCFAQATEETPNALNLKQNNWNVPANGTINEYVPYKSGGANCVLFLDGTALIPDCASIGTGLMISAGTISTAPPVLNAPSRSLNTCFQISTTRNALVFYAVDIQATLTLTSGPKGTAYLRTYTNSGCTTGQQTVISGTGGMPAVLAVAAGLQNVGTAVLAGVIAAGSWVKIEPVNDAGTPVFTLRTPSQEFLL